MNTNKSIGLLILAIGIFGLVACGGGGGASGGGGDGSGEFKYVGNTSPAVITAANATRLTAYAFDTGDLNDELPAASLSTTPVSYIYGLLPLLRILRTLPRPTPEVLSPTSMLARTATIDINETEQCYPIGSTEPSGFTTSTGTIDDQDGTGTVTLTYNACQDGDTFIEGVATWRIDKAYLTPDWTPLDSTFTFNKVTVIKPELNILLGGTLREQRNDLGSETLTFNFVLKDNDTQRMNKFENVVIDLAYINVGYYLSQYINGRFYDSVDGYLDVTTPRALLYEAYDSQYPFSGQLQLTGADSVSLRVTALSDVAALIELDLNNDRAYEIAGEIPWEVILAAGTNPDDRDGDGLPDEWEASNGLSNATYADASEDGDEDTLSNYEEYLLGTYPSSSDSDADGMPDGWEVTNGFNPISNQDAKLDFDGDNANNLQEYTYGTLPNDNTSTPADLSVSKSVALTTVSSGTVFACTLGLTNLGPGLARGVRLTDTLPDGAVIYTVAPDVLDFVRFPLDCTIGKGTLTCYPMMDTLAAGEEVTMVVPVIAPDTMGEITNSVVVTSTTFDFASANDNASVDTTVSSAVLTQVDIEIDDEGGVDGLERPFRLAVSPDGKHVYVPGIIDDAVAVFARDLISGNLTFIEAQRDGIDTPGQPDFPKEVAVSPDGKHVYVTTEWSYGQWVGSVVAYSRDNDTGSLTYIDKYRNGVDGVKGIAQAFAVTVSPDGKNVYVTGPNDNAVAVFNRNSNTGRLTYNSSVFNGIGSVDGIAGAFDVSLSPDNAFLYVAGDAIAVFSRGSDGALSYVGVMESVPGCLSIAVSSDGKHLYAVGDSLAAFSRNSGNGKLTHLETYKNGEGGAVKLEGMYDVAIAPDGKYVYVAAQYDSALGVFVRDSGTGTLRFIEVQKDGIGGVEGLGVSIAVAVSPDSSFVYVSGSSDNALSAFSVDRSANR